MKRRNFLSSLVGLAAWAKNGFSLSPAASAVPPTCDPGSTLNYFVATGNMIVRNPRDNVRIENINSDAGFYMGIPRTGYGMKVEPATASLDAHFTEKRLWFVRNGSDTLCGVMANTAQDARIEVDGLFA